MNDLLSSITNTAKIQVMFFIERNFCTVFCPKETNLNLNNTSKQVCQVLGKCTNCRLDMEGERNNSGFKVTAEVVCLSAVSRLVMFCFHKKLC